MNLATTSEAAQMLADRLGRSSIVTARTLKRWRVEGYGPRFIRLGGRVLYRDDDIDEFVASVLIGNDSRRAAGPRNGEAA